MATYDDTSGKGRYTQTVTIEVEVLVTPGEGNFNEVTTDDLRESIVNWIAREWLGEVKARQAKVRSNRGPGGSRYHFPGEGDNLDLFDRPTVSLDDLNVPTTEAVGR
jgi:hypothetical protein